MLIRRMGKEMVKRGLRLRVKKFYFFAISKARKRESTDHDHGVGERRNVVKDDGIENGTPQTNAL